MSDFPLPVLPPPNSSIKTLLPLLASKSKANFKFKLQKEKLCLKEEIDVFPGKRKWRESVRSRKELNAIQL